MIGAALLSTCHLLALALGVPFCASLMARGVGFGLFSHVS